MADSWAKIKQTHKRLERCWEVDIDWSLYPTTIRDGCCRVGKALNLPPTAVLSGYLILGSFVVSPSSITIPGTNWMEPVLIWLTVSMPTGTGKSTLFRHLYDIIQRVRKISGAKDSDPSWLMDDATFEKMGALMEENGSRLFGCYDEMSTFLTQINLYRGRNLSDSHELSLFLQLYNGHPWRRDTVGGEANFNMESTRLTIGGFTQAGVARNIIDLPGNSEKGLSHRFLWIFPEPLYGSFASLEEIDGDFLDKLSAVLSQQWRKGPSTPSIRVFSLETKTGPFSAYYDKIQDFLKKISGMDEFLAGMLSKSRGQVLRVAAILNVLFEEEGNIITERAMKAAINFVEVSCQHVAFTSGREKLEEEIEKYTREEFVHTPEDMVADDITAAHCLTLPGKHLYLTPLLAAKKFRRKGNKEGAVRAFNQLQDEGLGKTLLEVAKELCRLSTKRKLQFDETVEPRKSPRLTPVKTNT